MSDILTPSDLTLYAGGVTLIGTIFFATCLLMQSSWPAADRTKTALLVGRSTVYGLFWPLGPFGLGISYLLLNHTRTGTGILLLAAALLLCDWLLWAGLRAG